MPDPTPQQTRPEPLEDRLPLQAVRIAPGEYKITDREGDALGYVEGRSFAEWVVEMINGRAAALVDRDMEWWRALCLNDAVAPTPEAVKRDVLDVQALAEREAERRGAEAERERAVMAMTKVRGYANYHSPVDNVASYALMAIRDETNAFLRARGAEGEGK